VKPRFLSRTIGGATVLLIISAIAGAMSLAPVQGQVLDPATVQQNSSNAKALVADALVLPTDSGTAAEGPQVQALDAAGIQRLLDATGGTAKISLHSATGAVRFVRLEAGSLSLRVGTDTGYETQAAAFWREYGSIFGIRDANAELKLVKTETDNAGMTHLTYEQVYQGVPVFAGTLKVHFNAARQVTAVNGTFIPGITVSAAPQVTSVRAAGHAIAEVAAKPDMDGEVAITVDVGALKTKLNRLVVYRPGLALGVAGTNYLAYQVEVTNGKTIRDYVFVDAHTGKVVDRYSMSHDALKRVLYEQDPTTPPVWTEGDLFPGGLNQDQQNILVATEDSYYFFFHAFGRENPNADPTFEMKIVNNDPTISCPNANWNGETTNYCNGVTSDDVVAHEWGHAYTEFTHNLIYQAQSGALNESYSDIWGETIDMLNGIQTDAPVPIRSAGTCSALTTNALVVAVNSTNLNEDYPAGSAAFGPAVGTTPFQGQVIAAVDSGGVTTTDACEAITNGAQLSGKIALIERGNCNFPIKTKNAQNAGAIAVIIYNNPLNGDAIGNMSGTDATITIPSAQIGRTYGLRILNELSNNILVNASIQRAGGGAGENSYRWLMGEDSTAFGGAIRDMWNPTCKADAGKVSDAQYHCAASDGYGVHSNSGVPNHGYALLVDGGTYNGQTITAIGMTKAAHIYYRAMTQYQVADSNFQDHADALETSCNDLATAGTNLAGLSTTSTPAGPSGQVITAADCAEVAQVITAIQLRTPPTQCNFQPLLAKTPPALCSGLAGTTFATVFQEGFADPAIPGWTRTNAPGGPAPAGSGWDGINWQQDTTPPTGAPSGATAFATDTGDGVCGGAGGDNSGVRRLESPAITIPAATANARLAFDHYISTESQYDGGNVKLSINGGAFITIPTSAYLYNPYNINFAAAPGNTNPLAGEVAFSGTDPGEVGGSWGQSLVDLAALGVTAGNQIRLRYDYGQDGCGGVDGWYVDNVHVYTCGGTTAIQATSLTATSTTPVNAALPVGLVLGLLVLGAGLLIAKHRR
jgi:Zn-dependent metalloprotease